MEFLYLFLEKFGFGHPLHPALIHVPIGLVIGAFVFIVVALLFKRESYLTTAYRCTVLSLVFLVPAVLLGVTDWWHFYAGAWSFAIRMKIVLTFVLAILLGTAVVLEMKKKGSPAGKAIIYFFCVVAIAGLGYFGAELVYPGRSVAAADEKLKAGEERYATHCGGCHPKGGNALNPGIPVLGSSLLKDVETFTGFNRNPLRPDGSKGIMPSFPKEKISDKEMDLIYQYITKALKQG